MPIEKKSLSISLILSNLARALMSLSTINKIGSGSAEHPQQPYEYVASYA